MPKPQRKKPQALASEELPEFLHKLKDYDGHILTKLACAMLLTFVRTKELRQAEWKEFHLEERPQSGSFLPSG